MVKFKDCKTKKDKFKYIFSFIITVLVSVIIVFSVFFTGFYFIGGSCSNKASAAEISTETSLRITLPNTDFQLNNLTTSSSLQTNRYAQGWLDLTPAKSSFTLYNTLGDTVVLDFYAMTQHFVRQVNSTSASMISYFDYISLNGVQFGYFMFRYIEEFFPIDQRDNQLLFLYPDLNFSSVHLLNWSRSYYNHDELRDILLDNYYYVDDDVSHTIDIDIFDYFLGLRVVSMNTFQFSYIDSLNNSISFYIDLVLPAYGGASSPVLTGDYNFSLDTNFQVDNSEEAFNNGYQQGINVANAKEYEKGYEDGAEFGYTQGYYDGVDENLSNITPFGALRHGLTDLFAIELFPGFQLSTLFYIAVGVVLLGIIIKVFFHG